MRSLARLAIARLAVLLAFGSSLFGCASQQPLISHAHVGHGLTTWQDTPGNKGLFTVAREEIDIARHEADAALGAASAAEKATHINNAVHALNPDVQSKGTGLGYGAIRALGSAVSISNTPPRRRMPAKTSWCQWRRCPRLARESWVACERQYQARKRPV